MIRRAVPADVAACIELRGQTRENAIAPARLAELGITESSWSAQVASGELVGHVADHDGRIVGYCYGDVETGEVVVLALHAKHENRGLGKALLDVTAAALLAHGHDRLFLGCSADPRHRSHGFYRHLGWRPTGERDGRGDETLELVATGAPGR